MIHPSAFLDSDRDGLNRVAPSTSAPSLHSFATNSSSDGKRTARQRETQFILKHGQRHHSYDSEKAPYPLSYDRQVVEMEALDNLLTKHLRGSSSYVNFAEPPTRVLDLGCGTGSWIIEAAREWPECEFVGFDLVNVQFATKLLERSVANRIQWKHGNFLTTKLPFDDDEFDHVHVRSIARGVPENKWGNLFEEIARVLVPGGSVEVIEDDIMFPVLPRWFTSALRATHRPSTAPGSHPNGGAHFQRSHTPSSMTTIPAIPPHDHALLESLNNSVFEQRFINTKPTAVLPAYFHTSFRHVTVSPVITFPMPLLAPLLPLPPQIVTSYVIEPKSDTLEKRVSTISPGTFSSRPMSHSFSSSSTASTTSTAQSRNPSVFSKRPRTASASLSSPWSTSTSSIPSVLESVPASESPAKPIFRPFMLDSCPNDDDSCPFPASLFSLDQLREMSERSLAMHLYRSYKTVLACQEAMWEELKDRMRNRREELVPFGWEDDEELGELKGRKRFEKLIERFQSDMHIRMSLWTSLTGMGWQLPTREPLSKAELIEEERIREGMMRASKYVSLEDVQTSCRSVRVMVGYKSTA
ncbi:hypothetical protein D9611_005643 [Ephemerocybe angulata]|uniref:Uncharacterized protein n=2 Tax=Ephemerocybe angulata TaxID=980116 RepID=A0A8H5BH86_9AGAR|nr:hypothetical protein D9611_005643 [Tulosesus angulatus]KAF6766671.1 hypothetical protein DFP72DRAFT_867262 [Tulosesus angulatus]